MADTKKNPGERRQREREARRRLILEAAQSVFAERGFLRATVEEIATESELAVGTLYRYFQSKEEIYVSLLFEAMEMFHEQIETIRTQNIPPDEQLRAVWNFFYDFYHEQPAYYRAFIFLHHEGLREIISLEVLDEINHRAGKNFRLVGQIVEDGIAAGVYRQVDSRHVVDMLWALLMGLVQLTETRRNLGVHRSSSLETLHREAFEWVECGLKIS